MSCAIAAEESGSFCVMSITTPALIGMPSMTLIPAAGPAVVHARAEGDSDTVGRRASAAFPRRGDNTGPCSPKPDPEPVDIAAIAAAALRAHDLSEFGSVVALERVRATGDPDLLERLVANLVANAIHHNIVGGRIEVSTRAASGRAVLSVANTGPIIPAGELQRLFRPFQRLAPDAHTNGGIGLGLTIVQEIADAHRAVVTARAQADGGLEIHVTFPSILD